MAEKLTLDAEEILSKDEIKKLFDEINGKTTGLEDDHPVGKIRKLKLYDFRHPYRFSEEQLHNLSITHEALAQSWKPLFSQYCRDKVQINVSSVDPLRYDEFLRCVPNPMTLIVARGILNSVAIPMPFFIDIEPVLSKKILYYMFLGKTEDYGWDKPVINNTKELTYIEQAAMSYFSKQLLEKYSQVFSSQLGIQMELNFDSLITSPQYADIIPPQEMVALISLNMDGPYTKNNIDICLPYPFLKKIIKEVDNMAERDVSTVETSLDKLKVQVAVELGRTVKTLDEILRTEEGSIMELDTFVDEPVSIFVNNVLFAKGETFVENEKFAIKFIELLCPKFVQPESAAEEKSANAKLTEEEGNHAGR